MTPIKTPVHTGPEFLRWLITPGRTARIHCIVYFTSLMGYITRVRVDKFAGTAVARRSHRRLVPWTHQDKLGDHAWPDASVFCPGSRPEFERAPILILDHHAHENGLTSDRVVLRENQASDRILFVSGASTVEKKKGESGSGPCDATKPNESHESMSTSAVVMAAADVNCTKASRKQNKNAKQGSPNTRSLPGVGLF